MANQLFLGRDFYIEPREGVYIHDEIPIVPLAKIFDARVHSLNPLLEMDYKKLRQIVATFDTLFPGGEDTLTKMTGLSYLADKLDQGGDATTMVDLIPEPDKKSTTGHVWAYERVRDLMRSPTLKRMLTSPTSFAFPPDAVILARVNRRELTDFDAEAITFFLMATYPGQLVIRDFGFYGRDFHTSLLREERLIAGVRHLGELPDKLRRAVQMIEHKTIAGAYYDDAYLLAKHAGLQPDTIDFNDKVAEWMVMPEPAAPQRLWIPPPLPIAGGIVTPAKRKRRIWKRDRIST